MSHSKEVVGYNGSKFRSGQEAIRRSRLAIDKLPVTEEARKEILRIAQDIAKGTLASSEAIHHPFYEQQEIFDATRKGIVVGSGGDYETDASLLEEFPARFDPDYHYPTAWDTAIANPRVKAALDEGLADLAAGRTRVFKGTEFEVWIKNIGKSAARPND